MVCDTGQGGEALLLIVALLRATDPTQFISLHFFPLFYHFP
jgi:hypothetical protein